MSSSNDNTTAPATTTTTKTTAVEPVKEESKGLFLGIDFNKPEVLIGAAAISIPLAYFGINMIKQFIFREPATVNPQTQQNNRRIPKYTTEELRQMEYQRQLDLANKRRQMTEEEQYLEAMRMNNSIGQTNSNLSRYNVHRNYNPVPVTDLDNEIDIIDDNQVIYNNYVQQPQSQILPQYHQHPSHPSHSSQQPQQQQQPPPQQYQTQPQKPLIYRPLEDSLLINSDEINVYTDNEIDANSIPKEFTNVGNRPEPFENIKPIDNNNNNNEQPPQQQQQNSEDDIYNIENMEISEEDLKNMETKAYTDNSNNNEYYK